MAKSYTVTAEMEASGFDKGVANVKSQINSLKGLSSSLEKSFQVSGDFGKLNSGLKEATRGLNLAKGEVDRLEKSLAVAHKFNMDTSGINKLESELNKAKSQVEQFDTSIARMKGSATSGASSFERATGTVKNFGSNLLDIGSKVGNVVSGVTAGFSMIQGAVGTVSGVVGGFANTLMNTYDQQIGAQKTLSAVLSDGAEGYKYFNSQIDNGSLLLKSQKGDLNEIGATLASYTQMTGESAFKTANAINAVGDSLSVNMEGQKQFSLALAQAMGSGALHAQDFNQMMQTALGANFKQLLIDSANQGNAWGTVTQANFKEAMEAGVFNTDIMNKALISFQQTGEQVANAGFSTFEQIKASVKNGFEQSALEGFKNKMNEVEGGMDTLGNNATETASIVGTQAGQMSAEVVNSLMNIIDTNGDHKVSEEEVRDAVSEVTDKVKELSGQLQDGAKSFGDFTSNISQNLAPIIDAYNYVNNLWQSVEGFMNSIRNFNGGRGLLGGFVDWADSWLPSGRGGGGGASWLVQPDLFGMAKGIDTWSMPKGLMTGSLPLNLQTFATPSADVTGIQNAITNVSGSANSGRHEVSKTVIFQQTLMGKQTDDGGKAEIIKMLRKNGFEIKFT